MNTSDPNIVEHYKKLPEKLRNMLFAQETTDALFEIGTKNGLSVDQMGELADETGLIILGITKPEQYAYNIQRKLAATPERTNTIVRAVNEKIFEPIREDLRAIHKVMEAEKVEKKPPIQDVVSKLSAHSNAKTAPQ